MQILFEPMRIIARGFFIAAGVEQTTAFLAKDLVFCSFPI
jgi:hypothetical protein